MYWKYNVKISPAIDNSVPSIAKTLNPPMFLSHIIATIAIRHPRCLFGLERAGVLADIRFLGDHDWYTEGAEYLIGKQLPSGAWPGPGAHAVMNTCFALLFLRRATVPVRVPQAVTEPPRPMQPKKSDD